MKKIFLWVMITLSINFTSAQNCNTFSDKSNVTNWRGYAIDGISFQSDATHGNYLQLIDGSGSSYVVNDKEFAGNWLQLGANGCLCFEYNVDWNQDPNISTPPVKGPKIGIYTGTPANNDIGTKIRAGFLGNATNPDLKDNEWTKFCFPIGLSSNGKLPSNSLGTWTIASGSTVLTGAAACAAWDNLIQNVTGIYLYADYNAEPSELVRFDNFCWTCTSTGGGDVTVCGCPNSTNLINNGDFENGATGFTSKFIQMTNSFVPGTYTVSEYASSKDFCSNWNVSNPTSCPRGGAMQGKFLVVNGQTGQSGFKTAWAQTITVNTGRDYKICLNLKNLPQCCFDVKPVIRIMYNYGVQSNFAGPITVNQANTPCDWLKYTTTISIPVSGSPTTLLSINIDLDQSGLGDGNDLAIDDISLIQLEPMPKATNICWTSTEFQPNAAGIYQINASMTALPPNSGFYWEISLIEQNGVPLNPVITVINPAAWWTNPLFCDFKGYDGNTGQMTSSNAPGTFNINNRYRITRATWGDCNSWGTCSKTTTTDVGARKIKLVDDNYVPKRNQKN